MLNPGGNTMFVKMQNAIEATGNGVSVPVVNASDGAFTVIDMQVSGISGDTITFEGTVDGTNWVAITCENLNGGATSTTATADGIYRFIIGGVRLVRARISTYSAGTITVIGSAGA